VRVFQSNKHETLVVFVSWLSVSISKVVIQCFALMNLSIVIILLLGWVTRILFLDQTRRKVIHFITGTAWAQHQWEPEILETSGHNVWYQMAKKQTANSPAARGLELRDQGNSQ